MSKLTTAVVIPNWNGRDLIGTCLDSLLAQTYSCQIIVVDNGSVDGSAEFIAREYPTVDLVQLPKNRGFAGGVNAGIRRAIELEAEAVALFNSDAVAEADWLEQLAKYLGAHQSVGIVTGKLLAGDKQHLDSTGDYYTSWGLPYPRGRGEPDNGQYDQAGTVFGASGGASLYRITMLKEVGLFDEAFFAYYEDVELSFRAQLAGWQVAYQPTARAYHHTGSTSSRIKGFSTYQTLKNLPMIVRKNVPLALLPQVLPRFWLAYTSFVFSALARGQVWTVIKGVTMAILLLPKNFWQRRAIQKRKKVSVDYIRGLLVYDLPPNATRLRQLRGRWQRLFRRQSQTS